jgi:hypothetical protein
MENDFLSIKARNPVIFSLGIDPFQTQARVAELRPLESELRGSRGGSN